LYIIGGGMSAALAGAAIVMAAAPAIKLVLIHFMVRPHSANGVSGPSQQLFKRRLTLIFNREY
jgi:hypothetical protein